MKINHLHSSLIVLLALLMVGKSSKAQLGPPPTYSFYAYNETYNYLSAGTTITALTGQDDRAQTFVPIGFSFLYAGTTYTTLSVNTNGWISFNNYSATHNNDNQNLSNLNSFGPCLLPMWEDISALYGTVSYQTTGTAPNRVFTLEFKDFIWDYLGTSPTISFQVRLYEGGVIKYHYKQESGAVNIGTSYGCSIGIGASSTSWQFLNSSGTSPTTTTSSYTTTNYQITTRPATGQVYQFGDFPCNASPIPVATVTSTTANITWNAQAPSVHYEYVFNTTSTPPTTAGTPTTGLTYNATGLTPNTTYYFHLRNKCTNTQYTTWFTLPVPTNPPCTKPQGLRIKNLYLDSATVYWRKMKQANGYTYVVNTDRNEPSSSTTTKTITDTAFTAKQLLEGVTYYVHIRVSCAGGEFSEWSLDSFTTPIKCRPPQLNVDYEHIDRAIVYWSRVPSALTYEYEVSQSPTPLGKGTEIANNSFFAFPLKPGEVYYFHVRSRCLDQGIKDISEWNSTSFKTFPLSVNSVIGKDRTIYAFPNPVKDVITVRMDKYSGQQGQITVTDITGKTVHTQAFTTESIDINMSHIPKGVYLLKYSDMETAQTIKLIKE